MAEGYAVLIIDVIALTIMYIFAFLSRIELLNQKFLFKDDFFESFKLQDLLSLPYTLHNYIAVQLFVEASVFFVQRCDTKLYLTLIQFIISKFICLCGSSFHYAEYQFFSVCIRDGTLI